MNTMTQQKAIIFDSGILITFSMNCMLDIIRELKKKFNGKFLITKTVEYEAVKRPFNIKKYKLGALNINALISEGVLEFPASVGISNGEIEDKTQEILKEVNSIFHVGDRSLHLIDIGEASALALNSILNKKGTKSVIAIDERTTRMLIENQNNLKKLLEEKFNSEINVRPIKSQLLKDVTFIRSSELVYVAYKKGIIKGRDMLDAMLYGAKFKGCSISIDEIKEIERIV